MRGKRLTAFQIKALSKPGRYSDETGLYLQVARGGSKTWVFRFTLGGRAREMGLGSLALVSLAEARQRAVDARKLLAEGRDPIEERTAATARQNASTHTFREVAGLFLVAHEAGWKNAKHRQQVAATLAAYAYPQLGEMPVGAVTTADVLSVLSPIWLSKTETASRLRGRIEKVLTYAKSLGWRTGENPAVWADNLQPLLPTKGKVAPIEHHAAMHWRELPAFMAALADRPGMAAHALAFCILTASRTAETLGASWQEINLVARVWTIPAARMKAGREHRVPLSDQAIGILRAARPHPVGYVFPGVKHGAHLSGMAMSMVLRRMGCNVTVHGFRSAFRDWASEATSFDANTCEMALAHAISSGTEAAYRRGDLFEKRAALMQGWADFCFPSI